MAIKAANNNNSNTVLLTAATMTTMATLKNVPMGVCCYRAVLAVTAARNNDSSICTIEA